MPVLKSRAEECARKAAVLLSGSEIERHYRATAANLRKQAAEVTDAHAV